MLTLPPRVTDRAFARLAEIGASALRVAVEGGGCSGFQYDIRLDDPAEDDLVLEKDGGEHYMNSVIFGETAYDVQQGFVGDPVIPGA